MYKIILALCFVISFNTVGFANVITETTISGTIDIKANISQTTEINNLKIDIVSSSGAVAMSLAPNSALENNQIIIPQTKIDSLLDDTYKLVISGDGYVTSTSQTFTLPTFTNIVFSVVDFLQIPKEPQIIAYSVGGVVILKEDISKVSEIQNFKIDIVNSAGVTAMSLTPNKLVENNNIIVPNTAMDSLPNDTYKLVVSGDGYNTSNSQIFTLPTLANIIFSVTDFLQIPEKPHIVSPLTTYFELAITVIFAPVAEGIEIYYTTDGSIPTALSQRYVDGIGISESTIVKAITVRDNVASGVFERQYTINRPVSSVDTGSKTPINLNIPQATTTVKPQPIIAQAQTPSLPKTEKFSDVLGHWAKAYIDELVDGGIISGYEDKTFRPDDLITRAEAVKLIVCAMKLQPTQNPKLKFDDNSNIPSWATGYIDIALEKGITNGYDDNEFKALQNVSREELSVLAMRAFGATKSENITQFTDKSDISDWALDYINTATELGIITGYEDNTFKPNNNVTRAEAVVILSKCIHKLQAR